MLKQRVLDSVRSALSTRTDGFIGPKPRVQNPALLVQHFSVPKTPLLYADLNPFLSSRWSEVKESGLVEEWLPDYFFIPESNPQQVHILSAFYRSFIGCELMMTMHLMKVKQHDTAVPAEVLLYELVTLLDSWLDILKECFDRLQLLNNNPGIENGGAYSRVRNLQSYLWKRLLLNIEISIYELQIRFPLIPEERRVTREELYLKQLEQPLPDNKPYVRARALTLHELETAIRKETAINPIDNLLSEVQTEMYNCSDRELQPILKASVTLLENARLCAGLIAGTENKKTDLSGILETNRNRDRIVTLMNIFQEEDEGSAKEGEDLHLLMGTIQRYRTLFNIPDSDGSVRQSEAAQLICLIDRHFTSSHQSAVVDLSAAASAQTDAAGRQHLLDEYIDLDDLRKKLDVSDKTFKKYLSESGVEVIEFSTQRQLIHEDEVKKLLDYYKIIKQSE